VSEDDGPFVPISTYGASKLAGEALIASYCFMFDLTGYAFRFGNVVGPRQTHGVGYDFLRRLRVAPRHLDILGDGEQSKPYIHVDDVYRAVMTVHDREPSRFRTFNVAPPDQITVREIADLAISVVGREPNSVQYRFAGGSRGWRGDVPVVRLDCSRLRKLGWTPARDSRAAMQASLASMWQELEARQPG
jgi:UDP-glucose 4-epimerase